MHSPSDRNTKHKYDHITRNRTLTPKSAKAKGRALQNTIAELIRVKFNLHHDDVKPAIMGEKGVDIKLSRAAQERINLSIECKNQESVNIWKAYEQASINARHNEEPVVFLKRNRSPHLALVEANYLLDIIKLASTNDK